MIGVVVFYVNMKPISSVLRLSTACDCICSFIEL